ncbi:MAG: polyprenyl synthetase family protein [Puniceicoccaceae bacterium]
MQRSVADFLEESLEGYRTFAEGRNRDLSDRLGARIGSAELVAYLMEELTHPGKNLRPALTLAAYGVFSGGRTPSRECFAAAHALEVFHAFVLVHDDVIDQSDQRRQRPTLHRRLEKGLEVPYSTATHLAVILGDILFGFAVDLLSTPCLDHGTVADLQQYLAAVTQDTGLGEALELTFLHRTLPEVSRQRIEEVYYLKTTRYTIEAPLWLGGRAAGAKAADLEPLVEFARPIGLGFQMENDLHEASLPRESFRRLAYDFQTGVKTLFLRRLYDALDDAGREELTTLLPRCESDAASINRLHDLIHSTEALAAMKADVDDCFQSAREWIPGSPYPEDIQEGLRDLADFIFARRTHSENNGDS